MELQGRGAIVTGGGSGLGAETARHLAAAGANVCVLDINADAAAAVAGEVGGLGLACDVASAEAAEAAVARARGARGRAGSGQLRRHRAGQAHRGARRPDGARGLRKRH